MADEPKTGSVTSKSGKITARNIVTGIDIQGAASDVFLQAAATAIQHLRTGDVSAAEGVEASGDIVTGFRYLNPQAPTLEAFLMEAQALHRDLAEAAAAPDTPAPLAEAAESLGQAVTGAQKERPPAQKIITRLKETIQFIADAGKAIDAAHKAGPLIVQALAIAGGLYQAAQMLF